MQAPIARATTPVISTGVTPRLRGVTQWRDLHSFGRR